MVKKQPKAPPKGPRRLQKEEQRDCADEQWRAWVQELGDDVKLGEKRKEPPEAEVVGVQFGLLSSKDIARLSAVEVTHAVTHKAGVVQRGGSTESRLGTSNRAMLCSTCGSNHEQCAVGHSGHIQLRMPVPNGEYLNLVSKILECVCFNCCRLRLPKDAPTFGDIMSITSDKDRWKRLYGACRKREYCETWEDTKRRRKIQARVRRNGTTYAAEAAELDEEAPQQELTVEEMMAQGCGCGMRQPTWIKDDGIILRPVWKLTEDDRRRWREKDPTWEPPPACSPEDILRILQNISDDDVRIFGMHPTHSHPSSLMWSNLYVPTVNIRPSKMGRSGNNRCPNEDDLTLRLKAIEKNNLQLSGRIKKEEKKANGDKAVNLSKYRFNDREFDTLEAAFAAPPEGPRPQGRPPKPQAAPAKGPQSTYQLYDRLYRSVTSYQNSKLKGKGITQYGKDKKSLKDRFNGQKKNRVRGTVVRAVRATRCDEVLMGSFRRWARYERRGWFDCC